VAVIGAGSMGGMHAQLLGGIEGVSEVLVVDTDTERAALVAGNAGGRPVSHEQALDEADAVVIATPAALHAASVEAAVARRLPALCEKPLTDDLATSAALVRLVEDAGAHVEIGFQRRHEVSFVEARRRVACGDTGLIHLLRLTAFDPRVTPRAPSDWPPNDAAPLFLHSSVHDFDFARWITGQEVVEVTADGSRRDDPRPGDPRGVETALVTLRMSGGTLAVLVATWLHPAGYDSRVELIAERAHLTMGLSPRTPSSQLDWPGAGAEPWNGYLERYEAAYRAELVAFLAAARGERPPASTVRDGHEALRVAVAATVAYRERRTVTLTEVPDRATSGVA
jgi:myo-inositol 2-dehydrogenase/D-chiro-inositol 1-dehydrogenase